MMNEYALSDEVINSFIDNQLTTEEKQRIYSVQQEDQALSDYICRLRTLHNLIHDAYQDEAIPPQPEAWHKRDLKRIKYAAAVVLLFTFGLTTGWFGHKQWNHELRYSTHIGSTNSTTPAASRNVLLHVSSNDPERLASALNEAERLLIKSKERRIPLQLEILANEGGLDLLRSDATRYQSRITELTTNYGNVSFLACAKALQRLQEQGVDSQLVPEARIIPSALDEIVERMEKGWLYIKV